MNGMNSMNTICSGSSRHGIGWMLALFMGLHLLASQGPLAQEPRTLRPQQETSKPAATQEARIALVIGNGGYRQVPLKNPPHDARAMAGALQACGFQVQVLVDGSLPQMEAALRVFGQKLRAGGVGLFFYAGHGMQVKGTNYLIPVGADIGDEDEIRFKALDANEVLAKMESAGNGLNLMVLDACRNNPFGRGWRRGGAEGLAQMDAPTGTYIAFATGPGRTASDGSGANGLYTQHLLEALQQPGLKVEEVFKRVRMGVKQSSHDQQVPWDSSSLTGEFYFRGGRSQAAPAPIPTALVQAPAPLPAAPLDLGVAPPPLVSQALTGNLQVAVLGAEGKVFLDSVYKGVAKPETPLNVTGIPPGASRLKVEAPGCLPVKQSVQIEAGKWQQVAIPLKQFVELWIYRVPVGFFSLWAQIGIQVYLDEQKVAEMGNHDYFSIRVPVGSYILKLFEARYKIITTKTIDNNNQFQHYYKFEPISKGHGSIILSELDEATWKADVIKLNLRQINIEPGR